MATEKINQKITTTFDVKGAEESFNSISRLERSIKSFTKSIAKQNDVFTIFSKTIGTIDDSKLQDITKLSIELDKTLQKTAVSLGKYGVAQAKVNQINSLTRAKQELYDVDIKRKQESLDLSKKTNQEKLKKIQAKKEQKEIKKGGGLADVFGSFSKDISILRGIFYGGIFKKLIFSIDKFRTIATQNSITGGRVLQEKMLGNSLGFAGYGSFLQAQNFNIQDMMTFGEVDLNNIISRMLLGVGLNDSVKNIIQKASAMSPQRGSYLLNKLGGQELVQAGSAYRMARNGGNQRALNVAFNSPSLLNQSDLGNMNRLMIYRDNILSRLSELTVKALKPFRLALEDILGNLVITLNSSKVNIYIGYISTFFKQFILGFKDFFIGLEVVLKEFMGFLGIDLSFLNVSGDKMNLIVKFLGRMTGAFAGFYVLKKIFGIFRIFRPILPALTGIVTTVGSNSKSLLTSIKLFNFKTIFKSLKSLLFVLFGGFGRILKFIIPAVLLFLGVGGLENIGGRMEGQINLVTDILSYVGIAFALLPKSITNFLIKGVKTLFMMIPTILSTLGGYILTAFGILGRGLLAVFTAMNPIGWIITAIVTAISLYFLWDKYGEQIKKTVSKFWDDFIKYFTDTISKLWDTIKGLIKSIFPQYIQDKLIPKDNSTVTKDGATTSSFSGDFNPTPVNSYIIPPQTSNFNNLINKQSMVDGSYISSNKSYSNNVNNVTINVNNNDSALNIYKKISVVK
jgi:hypothetical protein